MAIKLRDYQLEACKNIVKEIQKGNKEILFCMATGAGKSCVMADFAMRVADRGMKTLIIVNRKELVNQQREYQDDKHFFGCLTADEFIDSNIVVAMLQSLQSRLKQEKYQEWLEEFDFIWFDEAHDYFLGNGIKKIKEFRKDTCNTIFVTASPWDERGYLLNCDSFVKGADTRDLIDLGYLVPPEVYIVDLFNFDNVKISRTTGDYDTTAVEDIVVDIDKMDKVLEGYLEYAKNLKTIAFCSSVKSAKEYSDYFKLNGVKAEYLSGDSPTQLRKQVLKDFKDGLIDVLFSVSLFVAGFNMPEIEAGLFLAPTKLLRRHIQSNGRLLRTCPRIGKTKALVLDFVGNNFRLGKCDDIRSYIKAPPKKDKEEEYTEIQCPICGTVFKIDEGVCPECGFVLELDEEGEGNVKKPKSKKDFEKLIKLKSVQQELHDIIFEFAGLNCLIKTEETNSVVNGRLVKKWCYGYRDDGTPIFKGDKDFSVEKYPYPLTTIAKKTNCWFVFHTICTSYNPSEGALRYYGKKLRKAKKFLEQIKNPDNRVFVNLYRLMD